MWRVMFSALFPGVQGLEGMHRIGLCLDSLVHHLITGPPPIGASMEDEVRKLCVQAYASPHHCRRCRHAVTPEIQV